MHRLIYLGGKLFTIFFIRIFLRPHIDIIVGPSTRRGLLRARPHSTPQTINRTLTTAKKDDQTGHHGPCPGHKYHLRLYYSMLLSWPAPSSCWLEMGSVADRGRVAGGGGRRRRVAAPVAAVVASWTSHRAIAVVLDGGAPSLPARARLRVRYSRSCPPPLVACIYSISARSKGTGKGRSGNNKSTHQRAHHEKTARDCCGGKAEQREGVPSRDGPGT